MSSAKKVVNVVFAGLGGQGVIKASDILADAAFRAGLDVKKAEVHGMAQRGGSVTSDVRFGDHVESPMIPWGEADFLLVLAPSEVEVTRPLLGKGGVLIAPDLVDEATLPNRKSLNVAPRSATLRLLRFGRAFSSTRSGGMRRPSFARSGRVTATSEGARTTRKSR